METTKSKSQPGGGKEIGAEPPVEEAELDDVSTNCVPLDGKVF